MRGPGQGNGESPSSPRRIEAHERRCEMLELRKQGKSFREIGAAVGCSVATAYQGVMQALAEITEEPAKEVRAMELARLDSMLLALWPYASQQKATDEHGKAVGPDVDAVDRVLKIMDRRAKYLGLDAPVKSEVGGPNGGAVPIALEELDLRLLSDEQLRAYQQIVQIARVPRAMLDAGKPGAPRVVEDVPADAVDVTPANPDQDSNPAHDSEPT